MTFDEWADKYALDDEPCTRQSRRQDCEAAWKAAREECAKEVRALAPPFEQTRHGTTDYERGVLDAVDAIMLRSNAPGNKPPTSGD